MEVNKIIYKRDSKGKIRVLHVNTSDEKIYSKEATKLAIVHDFIYQIEPDIWEKIRNSKTAKECKTHLGKMLKRQI